MGGGWRVGEEDLSLSQDFGGVERCVDYGAGGAVAEVAGVQKEGNRFLFGEGSIFLIIGEAVGFFFATSVGAGSRNGFAKAFN